MSAPSNPNTNIQFLDSLAMEQRSFDGDNDAWRVEFGGMSSSAISLSANSGDSVISYSPALSIKASVTAVSSSASTIIVPAFSCSGMVSFQVYTDTTSTITGAQLCTLEVSPSDTDNVWFATGLTLTPSTTTGVVVGSTKHTDFIARRARVSIASAISSGSFNIYTLAQAE